MCVSEVTSQEQQGWDSSHAGFGAQGHVLPKWWAPAPEVWRGHTSRGGDCRVAVPPAGGRF